MPVNEYEYEIRKERSRQCDEEDKVQASSPTNFFHTNAHRPTLQL